MKHRSRGGAPGEEYHDEQDQVNNANSAFILINRGPSSPDGSCGPYGPGDQAYRGGPVGQVVRWSSGSSGRGGHPG